MLYSSISVMSLYPNYPKVHGLVQRSPRPHFGEEIQVQNFDTDVILMR